MAFVILWIAKAIGVTVYLSQLVITYIAVRLDYELRWYVVTDRSLRIRHGVWVMREVTMSFANLQQVILSQGPLQRLWGYLTCGLRRPTVAGNPTGTTALKHTRCIPACSVESTTHLRFAIYFFRGFVNSGGPVCAIRRSLPIPLRWRSP